MCCQIGNASGILSHMAFGVSKDKVLDGEAEVFPRRDKSRVFYQDQSSPFGTRVENKEMPELVVYYIAGYETGELGLQDRRDAEDLMLAYLFHWPTCFSGRLGLWEIPGAF